MNISQFFFEISQDIESHILEPEKILTNLYNNHLKKEHRAKRSYHANNPKHSKSLFQPKTTLDKIFDMYHGEFTAESQKSKIIALLSAFVSYFPNETKKIPIDVREQILLQSPFQIFLNCLNDSIFATMIAKGEANNLDTLLLALPDKGYMIIKMAFQDLTFNLSKRYQKSYIKSFGKLPQTIDSLPHPLQYQILELLTKELENSTYEDNPCYEALAGLSSVLKNFPLLHKTLLSKLHSNLRSRDHYPLWEKSAFCLNQINDDMLCDKSEGETTLRDFRDYLTERRDIPLNVILKSLALLECFTHINNHLNAEIIQLLCHTSTMVITDENANTCLKALSIFCTQVSTYMDNHRAKMVECLMILLPDLSNDYLSTLELSKIDKLKYIFEKNPNYSEAVLTTLFETLIYTPHLSGDEILFDLFQKWQPLLISLEHQGKPFLKQLTNHFLEKEYSDWMRFEAFTRLIKCFSHLPNDAMTLTEFFLSLTHAVPRKKAEYAIGALGLLNFALKERHDAGLELLTWMNDTLAKKNKVWDWDYTEHPYFAIVEAFATMKSLLSIHNQLIKPVIMNLCYLVPPGTYASFIRDAVCKTIYALNAFLKYPCFTSEDKRNVFKMFTENPSINTELFLAEILCMQGHMTNKKVFIDRLINTDILINNRYFDRSNFNYLKTRTHAIFMLLTKITCNLEDSHEKLLSWTCILGGYIEKFSTMQFIPDRFFLINALAELFYVLERKNYLDNKFPKILSKCIDEYIQATPIEELKKLTM